MSGFYKNKDERNRDIILANSTRFAVPVTSNGKVSLRPITRYEQELDKQESAGASARLAIDRAMRGIKQ